MFTLFDKNHLNCKAGDVLMFSCSRTNCLFYAMLLLEHFCGFLEQSLNSRVRFASARSSFMSVLR